MPNRIIKESICTSDSISQCTWFEEVLFYRLIVNCDDYGRFDGRTAVIKSRLFPLVDSLTLKNVDDAIKKLVSIGLVSCYEAEGKPFLFLPTWNEHQSIRAKKSKYPEPENICNQMISDESKCPRNPIQSESNPIRNPNPKSYSTRDDGLGRIMTEYMRSICTDPSRESMDKLSAYYAVMGEEVCHFAINRAIDRDAKNWDYINGVLKKLQAAGVKCLADIAEKDKKPETTPSSGSAVKYKDMGGSRDVNDQMRKDMEWLEKFTGGDGNG